MSLRFLTSGESHGRALMGILEGMPSGLKISEDVLKRELQRRKLGYGRGARQKIEDDAVEVLSGIRHERTLGSPIGLLIWNRDWSAWQDVMQTGPAIARTGMAIAATLRDRAVHVPRPGHADRVGGIKYAHADLRNVLERASARETAMRVAIGTLARMFLSELGIAIGSRVTRIGKARDVSPVGFPVSELNERADRSQVRCLSRTAEKAMIAQISRAKKTGDTVGGVFEILAEGHPLGLGSYAQWDRRLEGPIAQALMSLNAIKGVEIGVGFQAAEIPGSLAHDPFYPDPAAKARSRGRRTGIRYRTNRSGGIDGGMTTGQPLVIRAAMKPLSTLMKPLPSVDLRNGGAKRGHIERSDVCAVPAAAVIGESLVALVLAQAILDKFGGDSMRELLPRVRKWNGAHV